MILNRRLRGRLLMALSLLLLPAAASAQQEVYNYTVGLLGAVGGSFDANPGDNLGNTGFQVNLGYVTEPGTHLVVRAGRLGLDKSEFFGSLTDAEMKYVTIGGEYRYHESVYDSGVYVALGGYRLEGDNGVRRSTEDTWGVSVGVTGELPIRRWLGLQVEFSGHYANFRDAQFFGMAHGGVVLHF